MNLTAVKNAVTSKAGLTMLKLNKQSPHILFGAGVVGVVTTAVLASKATLEVEGIMIAHEVEMGKVEYARENAPERYSEKALARDKAKIHTRTALKLVKNYGPTIIVGATTIGCFTGSHRILSARNAALGAAYSALDVSYRRYRDAIRDKFGDEVDRYIAHGVQEQEVIEETETGPQPTKIRKFDPDVAGKHPYARIWGPQSSSEWKYNPDHNIFYLRTAQKMANERLHAKGHLFLNEVYDMLGLERTKAGAVTGWILGHGDPYVTFGCFEGENDEGFYRFAVGDEKEILLDFNVCGTIHDKI